MHRRPCRKVEVHVKWDRVACRLLISVCLWGLALAGCERHDIGQPCPELLGGRPAAQSGATRVETMEVVGQDQSFPCDELICVATDGRPGYCSKKCRENAGCPSGFECREVQRLGFFAGQKFCTWKHCQKPQDCGLKSDFRCQPAPSAAANEELKLCEFRND